MDFSDAMAAVRAGTATEAEFSFVEKSHNDNKSAAAGHKGRADRLEPIMQQYEGLNATLKEFGFDTAADLKQQIAALKGLPAQKDSEINGLRSTFEQKFAALEAKEKAATERARKKSAEADLIPAFAKVFSSGSVVYKSLVADELVKYDENEQAYVTLEGIDYRGDALALKLKDHPEYKEMALNTQSGGSGSSGGEGGTGSKTMSRAEFEKLPYSDQAAKMKDGYKLF